MTDNQIIQKACVSETLRKEWKAPTLTLLTETNASLKTSLNSKEGQGVNSSIKGTS